MSSVLIALNGLSRVGLLKLCCIRSVGPLLLSFSLVFSGGGSLVSARTGAMQGDM